MKRIVNYFIRYHVTGNVLMWLILIFGIFGMFSIRSTFFPQTPIRNIIINAVYPGASAEEIEESVVLKIEDKLKGVAGVDRVTSTSSENAANINVEIKYSADVDDVLQNVKNTVDQIPSFPVGVESIDIYKREVQSNAMSFAITDSSPVQGNSQLYELKQVSRRIERDLLNMDGISIVEISGFPEEEIAIEFRDDRLKAYGITMQDVLNRISSGNIEITGGTVKGQAEEYKIRFKNKMYYGNDLKNMYIVSKSDGTVVQLKDVASVEDQWAETPNRNYLNGKPAVIVDVKHTNDEDLLDITDKVRTYIRKFNAKKDGVQLTITRDQSDVVQQRIGMLNKNGMIGFVIVFVLLAMFLHYRLAFWVALSIPISFAGMFILASFFDVTINVISLFGMITVIGILVDDGVVVSENIYRHFEMGKSRIRAAIDGTLEVVPAVFSAILTTIIVFSTFFFVEGRLGDFFGEMAFIVIATLLFSLVEGIFILPAHVAHSKALDRDARPNKIQRILTFVMDWLKDKLYKPVLLFSMKHSFFAISIPLGFLIITFGAMSGGVIKSTFFPQIESDDINVSLQMPAGTREDITKMHLDSLESAVWAVNVDLRNEAEVAVDNILFIEKRVGPTNGNTGTMRIQLLAGEVREFKQLDIADRIREKMGDVPGAESLIFDGGGPFGKPVSVALRSENMQTLRSATEALKAELRLLSELKDVSDNDALGVKEINMRLKEKAYLLGFTERDIAAQVRRGYFGGEVQRLQRGLDEVRVWVRYGIEDRSNINRLRQMEIKGANGNYKLGELVEMEVKRGVVNISHTNGNREVMVMADVANDKVSASEMIGLIRSDIVPKLKETYPDLEVAFEGQNREQMKSASSIMRILPIVLLLMIAVIVFTFRSFLQTLVVLLLIPFGFIGVAWGHYVHDAQISFFSILGMIALIGILINDSLVFVSAFNTNIKNRMPFEEALMEAALSRFRPILLTSITTIAGLAPLIAETSFQAQFLVPMALSIAYGLAVATVVILIILPVLLIAINRLKRFLKWFWHDEKVSPESVEPAFKELKYEELE